MWPMIKRSIKVALVVGTILVTINQYDVIFDDTIDTTLLTKLLLTYLVPFCVSMHGQLCARRDATVASCSRQQLPPGSSRPGN